MILIKLIILFTLILSLPAHSFGILDAYSLALENDPMFRAALKEKEAGNEIEAISRSEFFPKISLNYQNAPHNWQVQKYEQKNIFGQLSKVTKQQQYRSYSGSIVLTQPLFDYEIYAQYKASVAQKMISDERYRSKLLDLAVRVINAYIEVAYSKDKIALAEAQKKSYKEQLTLNKRLMEEGEGTITDVLETQARYSIAESQRIEAYDALDAAQRDLEQIIGIRLEQLDDIQVLRSDKFSIMPLGTTSFDDWKDIALKKNPELAAARYRINAAKYEVEKNKAGYMPKIQLYASYSDNNSSSDNTVHQKFDTRTIGIQVSLPVYSGGRVGALTRQAAARYGQALAEFDAQTGNILNTLHKQFNLCVSSPAKLRAYELAIKSAEKQVVATRQSMLAGQRVNVDVLNAEQQLYAAKRDIAFIKYTYIKSWISFLSISGVLNEKDILNVAQYFPPLHHGKYDAKNSKG